jgi:hypothetical protein
MENAYYTFYSLSNAATVTIHGDKFTATTHTNVNNVHFSFRKEHVLMVYRIILFVVDLHSRITG